MILKVYFSYLYIVLGTPLLWISTVAFTYLKVKSAECLCLLPVVLVLVLFTSLVCVGGGSSSVGFLSLPSPSSDRFAERDVFELSIRP